MLYDDILYHQTRASRELDLGLSTDNLAAARAHLKLATLHSERAKELARDIEDRERPLAVA
ncbi:hypothetical protein ACFQPG_04255 [Sphingomonas sp. GCM10030256]|uniref:hypothetical protein n=1 Tax=Sphingomonas sp. GCM10030256 TaxID=3273427 RepID=UPI0036203F67